MKHGIFLAVYMMLAGSLYAQFPVFEWAKKTNAGTGEEGGSSVAVDAAGNVYTTGYFNGTVDFDPGPGTFIMSTAGASDVYVMKLDASGNFIWAKKMGGAQYEGCFGIAVNAGGQVYIAGGFEATVDFDPGPAMFNLTEFGGGDIFVSKLDAAGNFLWARQLGGAAGDYGSGMALDAAGNVCITGGINSTADFDPGPGIFNLSPAGAGDAFICKLNASGDFLWAKQVGGTTPGDYCFGYSMAVDPSGNIYSTGSFGGTIDLDPGAGTSFVSSTGGDIYISKLDANGDFIWGNVFAASSAFDYGYSYTIAADAGHVYIAGYFAGNMDFDPGAGSHVLSSIDVTDDIFICKLDAAGNYEWARQLGGGDAEYVYGITTDAGGNVYTTGYFNFTTDFDPGPGTFNLSSNAGSADIFISKLDAAGNFSWAKAMGGTGFDNSLSITVDAFNNIYTTGSFKGVVDFDPGAGVFNQVASGSNDAFIHKMSQPVILPVELLSFTGKNTNGINHIEWVTALEINNDHFTLEKSRDGHLFQQLILIAGAGNSNHPLQYSFDDKNPYSGTSYYRLKQTNTDGRYQYSGIIAIKQNEMDQPLTVFPNPAIDKINLNFYAPDKGLVKFLIINNAGMMLKSIEQFAAEGKNIITADVSQLPKGTYHISVIKDNTGSNLPAAGFVKN
jgi:hypothetical protein